MFDEILGLPLHPLAVHAPVVLVPLSALGVIAMALVPRWSRRFGPVVALVALAGAVSAFVAKESGEALRDNRIELGQQFPSDSHFTYGDLMPIFAGLLFLAALGLWLLDRGTPGDRQRLIGTKIVAALGIVVAVASVYWVVRTGDSGARLVWG
ncbi:MAG: DUF2231 domain-containing protein [Candidatus Nanopelagicales bacterium]